MPSLFFVFKKQAQSQLENIVQWCAGPMVHVDMIVSDRRLMFTSYMFERFSMNRPDGYSPETHTCLKIDVSQEAHDAALAMLLRFVGKQVPYNYADVFKLMVPSVAAPRDILDEEQIETLFCSQAVTVVLRHCLEDGNPLHPVIMNMNSRVTTPSMLYEAVEPFCQQTEEFFNI